MQIKVSQEESISQFIYNRENQYQLKQIPKNNEDETKSKSKRGPKPQVYDVVSC